MKMNTFLKKDIPSGPEVLKELEMMIDGLENVSAQVLIKFQITLQVSMVAVKLLSSLRLHLYHIPLCISVVNETQSFTTEVWRRFCDGNSEFIHTS